MSKDKTLVIDVNNLTSSPDGMFNNITTLKSCSKFPVFEEMMQALV
ncbi:MAG UNVERIFIED_CONTAM: hypothetical protein LVQ98_01685 [Rickettsiaceae bacterium]|jgi:hypothetical protein